MLIVKTHGRSRRVYLKLCPMKTSASQDIALRWAANLVASPFVQKISPQVRTSFDYGLVKWNRRGKYWNTSQHPERVWNPQVNGAPVFLLSYRDIFDAPTFAFFKRPRQYMDRTHFRKLSTLDMLTYNTKDSSRWQSSEAWCKNVLRKRYSTCVSQTRTSSKEQNYNTKQYIKKLLTVVLG